jgi:hypothetical protein
MAELADFPAWKDDGEVNFAAVLKAAPGQITPYCLDLPRKRVIFVEVRNMYGWVIGWLVVVWVAAGWWQ